MYLKASARDHQNFISMVANETEFNEPLSSALLACHGQIVWFPHVS